MAVWRFDADCSGRDAPTARPPGGSGVGRALRASRRAIPMWQGRPRPCFRLRRAVASDEWEGRPLCRPQGNQSQPAAEGDKPHRCGNAAGLVFLVTLYEGCLPSLRRRHGKAGSGLALLTCGDGSSQGQLPKPTCLWGFSSFLREHSSFSASMRSMLVTSSPR